MHSSLVTSYLNYFTNSWFFSSVPYWSTLLIAIRKDVIRTNHIIYKIQYKMKVRGWSFKS
jgi:hypothetical protein